MEINIFVILTKKSETEQLKRKLDYPVYTISPQTSRNSCGFLLAAFTGNAPRKGWRIPLNEVKYNEQRDEETDMGQGTGTCPNNNNK